MSKPVLAMFRVRVDRIRTGLIGVSLFVGSITITLLCIEFYLRNFAPQPIVPRYVEASSYGIRKNIGYVSGKFITPEFQHHLTTNSQGFRGKIEYAIPKPQGVFRIIVLGDSTTLGHGVEDEETFSFLLERYLNKSRPTEVINMGVSGFGTAEELIQLRHVGLKYEPDLVIIGYFPNDPYNNMVSKLFRISGEKIVRDDEGFVPAIYLRDRLYAIPGWAYLCQHSHVVNLVRNRLSALFVDVLGKKHRMISTVSRVLDAEQTRLTALLLRQIQHDSHEHGAAFLLLNIPAILEGEIIDNCPIDLLPPPSKDFHIINVNREVYKGHSIKLLSFSKDSHPTPFAHRLIAEHLSLFVQEHLWKAEKRDEDIVLRQSPTIRGS